MTASFDYTKVNLYDVLGIETDASEKEVCIYLLKNKNKFEIFLKVKVSCFPLLVTNSKPNLSMNFIDLRQFSDL